MKGTRSCCSGPSLMRSTGAAAQILDLITLSSLSSLPGCLQGLEVDSVTGHIRARPPASKWPRIAADQEAWAAQVGCLGRELPRQLRCRQLQRKSRHSYVPSLPTH